MKRILVTGAAGQIGTDLIGVLQSRYGEGAVIASDILPQPPGGLAASGALYEQVDVVDAPRLNQVMEEHRVDTVFHLASLLSARGEQMPDLAWRVNMDGLKHVLDIAHEKQLRVFWPSSIAVFGPSTPRISTPQQTVLDPNTMYGVTKVSGELLCRWYAEKKGVDVRSIRYPGIISYTAPPGGGTTDYAVEIFHEALRNGTYRCFLSAETRLPMMYMPDALRATLEIMDAEPDRIKIRTSYNLAAVSFTARELARKIRNHLPGFTCTYEPDSRQAIADSWPESIDDTAAREDWGWRHEWDLPAMTRDMIEHLAPQIAGPAEPESAART